MIFLAKSGNGLVVTTILTPGISHGAELQVSTTVSLWSIKWFSEAVLSTRLLDTPESVIATFSQPMLVGK